MSGAQPDIPLLLARARQAVSRGEFADAEFWYRQILAVRPQHAEALAGLGQKLCWDRKRREGLKLLRQAARQLEKDAIKSRDSGALTDLSEQLQRWGDIEPALTLARLAVRLNPKSAKTQNNLALCLSRVNRDQEALPVAQRACELRPDEPACNILLALLEARQRDFARARERLERVIAANRDAAQTARAWLELGAVLDKVGEFDRAFEAFGRAAAGHRALPETAGVDPRRIFETIARNKAGFDRALLRRWTAADLDDGLPAPAFLCGFLRSGTTLTEQVLAVHPDVLTSDESDFILELTQELARISGVGDDVPAALRKIGPAEARRLRRLYWQRVEEEYGPERRWRCFVDKVALNSVDAGFIAALFPEARILFALRDPRDIALSCYTQAFSLSPGTVNLLSWEGIARQYAAVMDLWLHLRQQIGAAYLELRYEDAVEQFEPTYRRVFEWLGIDWRPEVAAFHQKARGRFISTPSFSAVTQPLYRSAIGRWRAYRNHFDPVIGLLDPYIDAFGYRN